MDTKVLFELEWPYLLGCLPREIDLDETAQRFGALTRRRCVKDAPTLLRLALAYGFCGLSLRQTAAWAEACGVASISNVALLKRLRSSADWLGHLVSAKLAESAAIPSLPATQYNIRLVDATTIRGPGDTSTYFRLHLGFNLKRQVIDHLEVTTERGGESLKRFSFAAGDLVVGDAGYTRSPGLYSVVQAGADFLVRHCWQSLPLTRVDGQPLDLLELVRSLPDAQAASFPVMVRTSRDKRTPAFEARLVVLRKSEEAAKQARAKVLRRRSRQSKTLDPRSLEYAGYVCLLTTLQPQTVDSASVLDLYRFRWQIEMVFKRLKGLLDLGQVPSRDPALARTVIFAKLLTALIVSDYSGRYLDFFPWGYGHFKTPPVVVAH